MGYNVDKKKIYDFIDNGLRDKDYHLQTTSKKFKKDMVDFFDFPEANKTFNVFFIDCVHDYAHFHSDVQHSIAIADNSQPVYFIVDDYGTSLNDNFEKTWDGSINLYVNENLLPANKGMSIVARLGLSEGDMYHEEREPLKDSEGVIIKWEI